jgi:hypothetical protein
MRPNHSAILVDLQPCYLKRNFNNGSDGHTEFQVGYNALVSEGAVPPDQLSNVQAALPNYYGFSGAHYHCRS